MSANWFRDLLNSSRRGNSDGNSNNNSSRSNNDYPGAASRTHGTQGGGNEGPNTSNTSNTPYSNSSNGGPTMTMGAAMERVSGGYCGDVTDEKEEGSMQSSTL